MKSVPKSIQVSKDLSHQIPWSTSVSLHSELPQGMLKVNSCSRTGLISIEADGKFPCCSVIGNAIGKCKFVDRSNPCRGAFSTAEPPGKPFMTLGLSNKNTYF